MKSSSGSPLAVKTDHIASAYSLAAPVTVRLRKLFLTTVIVVVAVAVPEVAVMWLYLVQSGHDTCRIDGRDLRVVGSPNKRERLYVDRR